MFVTVLQLIGISVPGLEPEFQPVVNYLLPQIVSHEQDSNGLHLQLLQDVTDRLHAFLPQLEADLPKYADDYETGTRFLAMLAGPFYPILHIVAERETARTSTSGIDTEATRNSQPSPALTVSSNFEPRRSRGTPPFPSPNSRSTVFRPDAVFTLLRKAFADNLLGTICKVASRVLHYLAETTFVEEQSSVCMGGTSSLLEEAPGVNSRNQVVVSDYSELFGEEFRIPVVDWDPSYTNVLDLGVVEEGILHVLYACASEPLLCSKLACSAGDFWLALPLIQALLPALRPASCSLSVDDTFSQWAQPFVRQALSKVVSTLSSTVYHPLLHGCAGYLSSYSPSHAKTACVLIDLCSNALAPWISLVVAKIDLAMELLEDLLGLIQGEHNSIVRVRAALKYFVLALSGYMDDGLTEYKEAKLRVLFLVEMLEGFLEPAITASQNMVGCSEVSYKFLNDREHICSIALHVICSAVRKPSVLPSLELQWRLGSMPPSVLLSILDPHLQLPSEIDYCKSSFSKPDKETSNVSSSCAPSGESSLKSTAQDDSDGLADVPGKVDILEDANLLFAPQEVINLNLINSLENTAVNGTQIICSDPNYADEPVPRKDLSMKVPRGAIFDSGSSMKYFSLHIDHAHLLDYEDCESRAAKFRQLALDLHSQDNINLEGHNAAIDALILSAECYINPFFMMFAKEHAMVRNQMNFYGAKFPGDLEMSEIRKALGKGKCDLQTVRYLERKRDKVFIQILLEAAEMDRRYYQNMSNGEHCPYGAEADDEVRNLSERDTASVDAITLVRRNQALLCNFLIHRLCSEQQSLHETLMQALLFLLHSSTKLVCPPEHVIDIILGSAELLNRLLINIFRQYKEGSRQLSPEKVYRVQRQWTILQSLVIASSGGSSRSNDVFNVSGFAYSNLIPPAAWMCKIPAYSSSAFPLVRYLGWMAISRNAKGYLDQHLFLTSNLHQLAHLLSIFADDLAGLDSAADWKKEGVNLEGLQIKQEVKMEDKFCGDQYQDQSFTVVYPVLSFFFPEMHKEFKAFTESILEAVGVQLRSLPFTAVPDILCWFADLCVSPFQQKLDQKHDSFPPFKGYNLKNARAIILYLLEAIVSEHMETIVPEMPRLVQVLGSLCRSSYCDVSFLSSILRLVKPIMSYSLRKASNEDKHIGGDSCLNFESLCFDEFFAFVRWDENPDCPTKGVNVALIMYVLASVFCDLSLERKRELIQASFQWVNFPAVEPTSTFHDYLCSFQQLLQSCNAFLVENLRQVGLIPMPQPADVNVHVVGNNRPESYTWFPDDFCYGRPTVGLTSEDHESIRPTQCIASYNLSSEDMEGLSRDIDSLISKLCLTIELTWSLHPQLSRNIAICSAQCLMYARCLSSVMHERSGVSVGEDYKICICRSFDDFFTHWKIGIEGIAENVNLVVEKNCWEVASTMIDCLLRLPAFCSLDNVVGMLTSLIEKIMYSAPKISWRLQTDRWLLNLFSRGILMQESGFCLVELVSKMLSHSEPEQRFTALMHLGRVLGLNVDGGWVVLASPSFDKLASHDRVVSISEAVLSLLISNTWDQVAFMASADASLQLRILAEALLVHYIPFAARDKLRSFLANAEMFFQGLGNFAYPMGEGIFAQLSLALIAGVCLYCPPEDLSLVPLNVWRYIETLGVSKAGRVREMEKKICQALCKVKHEEEDAKEVLKAALSSCPSKELDPDFGSTRESVLQVLANLTSVQSYFDIFAEKMDQDVAELEEAELEMDILQKEASLQGDYAKGDGPPFSLGTKDLHHLQQIKDGIRSLEKSRLRDEIIARRQKKLLLRRTRQKYIEDATLREAELLQELDRQRTLETEKELERQQLLELERAKTNELRYNLELEKERQTQREIQRELEQVESGSRPPRREFSSATHSSRPRDRYGERENGRPVGDSSLRSSAAGDIPVNNPSLPATPTVVLSGSRTLSGQLPTILQARDRADDCGSSYEENFDGSRDSGDTGSTGDPDSGFDSLSGGFPGSQRHGSRGSKSRQILERRERDGRREGKWERKH